MASLTIVVRERYGPVTGAAILALEEVLHGVNCFAFLDAKDLRVAKFTAIPDSVFFM